MEAGSIAAAREGTLLPTQRFWTRDALRCLAFISFFAVFANIPYWVASYWFGILPLGWFCLEYAVAGLVALVAPPAVAGSALLVLVGADLLSGISKTYWISPVECLANLMSLGDLSRSRMMATLIVSIVTVAVVAIPFLTPISKVRGIYRSFAAWWLVGFVVLGLSADLLSVEREMGRSVNPFKVVRPTDSNRFVSYQSLWISRYPLFRLVRDERLFGKTAASSGSSEAFLATLHQSPSAAALAIHNAGIDRKKGSEAMPNLVVIVVESWGLAADPAVQDLMLDHYSGEEMRSRYEVSHGTVPFYGSTVSGEARELCGSVSTFEIVNVPSTQLGSCLPGEREAMGYHSIAVHGMSGRMFNRAAWYDRIGFQEQWFRDRLLQQGLTDCEGAFTGICDADIANWIGRRLERHEASPAFVYWVTLNSHLPVLVPNKLAAGASCSSTPLLAHEPVFCSWYQLVSNVHESVARLALSNLARPTVFAIVGDHAPPFSNPELRREFSSAQVPYVLLIPRQRATQASKNLELARDGSPSR